MAVLDLGDHGRPYRLCDRQRVSIRQRAAILCGALLLSFSLGVHAAQDLDEFELTRRIVASGVIDLAIERIDRNQPNDQAVSIWPDWELLRLNALFARGRHVEILKRVATIRTLALPDRAVVPIWTLAARSALHVGLAQEARGFLVRALLRTDPASSDYRRLRIAVIESYLADRNADDAYRSMLRFQQDFSPLARDEIERFVAQLIAAGRAADAATWLTQLDPHSPWTSQLRLRAGLITADAAIKQARALLAKGSDEAAWALLLAGGRAQQNRAIEIEVQEARLNGLGRTDLAAIGEQAASLWAIYQDAGQQAANQMQLLTGDDAGWAQQAGRIAATQPQLARALYASIAISVRTAPPRELAQLQLVSSLRDAKLPNVALDLFADSGRFPVATMGPRLRLLLGSLAVEARRGVEAVRYWQNLPTPEGLSATEWQVRYLSALFQAGMVDAGVGHAKALLGAKSVLADEQLKRLIGVASDALDVWHVRAAEALFGMLVARVSGADRVAVLLGLGRARELTGEFRLAADAFLQVAALAAHPESDREALRARELGALNLAKAGMLEDARAAYRWLATHAKDNSIRDAALRALKNL